MTLAKPADSLRVAVAVSGGGRSLENLLRVQAAGRVRYRVSAVIASRPDCRGVEIATAHGLPTLIEKFPLAPDPALTARLYRFLATHDIGWIALAGFLRPFPISPEWRRRIVNIHPALLPDFGGRGMYGDRVHAAVLASGAATSGATIHFVDDRYDEGDIVAQIEVAVRPGDDVHGLASRVFAAECRLYPEVLERLVGGTLPMEGRAVLRMQAEDGS